MGIEKKIVPYEVLLRFGHNAPHQDVKPGEFAGAHFQEAELVVDDATGELYSTKLLPPVAVERERLAALCGEQAAQFSAGYDAAIAVRDTAVKERDAAIATCDAACKDRDAAARERDALKAELGAIHAAIGQLVAAKAG